jgi:Mor family transcriptional regulator
MGKPSPIETKRNKELIADYKSGKLPIVRLVAKYRISSTRIYQILGQYDILTFKRKTKKSKK